MNILLDKWEAKLLDGIAVLRGAVAHAGAANAFEEGGALTTLLGDEHCVAGAFGTGKGTKPVDKLPPYALPPRAGTGDDVAKHRNRRALLAWF